MSDLTFILDCIRNATLMLERVSYLPLNQMLWECSKLWTTLRDAFMIHNIFQCTRRHKFITLNIPSNIFVFPGLCALRQQGVPRCVQHLLHISDTTCDNCTHANEFIVKYLRLCRNPLKKHSTMSRTLLGVSALMKRRPLIFNSIVYGSFYTGAEFAQQSYNRRYQVSSATSTLKLLISYSSYVHFFHNPV